MQKKTETNVESITVKATELVQLQSVSGPNKTTASGYYSNKSLDVVGTLDQILTINSNFGAYALHANPANVAGCTAQYSAAKGWVGCLGSFVSEVAFRTSVPAATSAVAFGLAWCIINGSVFIVASGFTLTALGGGPSSPAGDGGVQGTYVGTFDNKTAVETALPSSTPGSYATTRDGVVVVFKSDV